MTSRPPGKQGNPLAGCGVIAVFVIGVFLIFGISTGHSTPQQRLPKKGMLGIPLPIGAVRVEYFPRQAATLEGSGSDETETYKIKASDLQLLTFFRREMIADGWAINSLPTSKSTIYFTKGEFSRYQFKDKQSSVRISYYDGGFSVTGSPPKRLLREPLVLQTAAAKKHPGYLLAKSVYDEAVRLLKLGQELSPLRKAGTQEGIDACWEKTASQRLLRQVNDNIDKLKDLDPTFFIDLNTPSWALRDCVGCDPQKSDDGCREAEETLGLNAIRAGSSLAEPPNANEIDVYINGSWVCKGVLVDGAPFIPEKALSKFQGVHSIYDQKWKKVSITIDEKETTQPKVKSEEVKKDLTYDESDFEEDRDSLDQLHITGKIKNTSGRTLPYIEIKFNGFDKNGSQIESSFDNTNDLAPGDTWKFDAWFLDEKVVSWRLVRVGT